jgi:signal transduction histidine kinase
MAAGERRRVPPFAVDVVVAVVAAVAGVAREMASPSPDLKHVTAPLWVYALAQVAAAAVLLLRRQRPYAVTLAIGAISLLVPAWAAIFAPYAALAHGRDRWRGWAVTVVMALCWLAGAHAWRVDDPFSGPSLFLASALLGFAVQGRRRLIVEVAGRAAERARADERIRLAGEMHDVVTHRINLMVLQAGALRVSATDDGVRSAAEDLRVAGCQALAELRDLVGVLRTGGPSVVPSASDTGERLDELVAESSALGLAVTLEEDGAAEAVAPPVRRTVFRLVQESLTNVHKHAPGARAAVSVRYRHDGVRVRVSNTAPAGPPETQLAAVGGGTGLAGLRHRVELVGGEMTAGGDGDGGFTVSARLPAYVPATAPR